MRFQRLTHYLLSHRWQALLLTFLMTYVPLLGLASIIVAGLFTLCVGVFEGALFTIVASLPYVLAAYGMPAAEMTPILWTTIILTITGNILTFVFVVMLRRHCSWSQLLQVAALLGAFVICIIHYFYPNITEWWAAQLQLFYKQSTATLLHMAKPEQIPPLGEMQMETINIIKLYATGIITTFVLFSAVMQALVARWWQLSIVTHGRISRELQSIRLSHLAGYLFILAVILYYLENAIVLDILPVLCLLFGAAGLSLVHYLCTAWGASQGRLWISVLYLVLIVSLVMMALLPLFKILGIVFPVVLAVLLLMTCIFIFIILALLDVWLDLRKRVRKF